MGLFDLFSDFIPPEIQELGAELQNLKDEAIASVMGPSTELGEAISTIANDLTGQATSISDTASSAVQDVKGAADSVSQSIPIINGNK